MKKTIVCILAFWGLCLNAHSQLSFGPMVGLNAAYLSKSTGTIDQQPSSQKASKIIAGAAAGGFVNYAFGEHLGIQTELLFSMQGGNTPYIKVRQNYLNLPLLIDIKPIKQNALSVLAGVQFGFCFGRKHDDTKLIPNRLFDTSAVVGLQYVFFKHLQLGLRYNIGLIPSLDLREPQMEIKGQRNNVIQLNVGWRF